VAIVKPCTINRKSNKEAERFRRYRRTFFFYAHFWLASSARRAGLARREFHITGNLHKKFVQKCVKFVHFFLPKTLDISVRLCYNVITTKGKKVNKMDTYKILLHYGEIVADKNHETVDGNFIRFTTFKYNNTYFIATLFNGDVISVAEKELEE
jgi:hypothetical protein